MGSSPTSRIFISNALGFFNTYTNVISLQAIGGPHRLAARTSGSHPGNGSSILPGVTLAPVAQLDRATVF